MLQLHGEDRFGDTVTLRDLAYVRIESRSLLLPETFISCDSRGWLVKGIRVKRLRIEGPALDVIVLLRGRRRSLGIFRFVVLEGLSLSSDVGPIAVFVENRDCWDVGRGKCADVIVLQLAARDTAKLATSSANWNIVHRRSHRRIAERAYQRAERRGFAPGHDVDDWLAAEREIASERLH